MTAACIALLALALAFGGWWAFRAESARIDSRISTVLTDIDMDEEQW